MERVTALLTEPYADVNVPRSLSKRLNAAELEITGRHTHIVLNWNLNPDTYSGQLMPYIKSMCKLSDDFVAFDWENWVVDQPEKVESNEYMFSLKRYIFCAIKPN